MTHTYTVPEGIRHLRADKALAIAFPDHSRTALQRAFDSGLVTLRGAAIKRDQSVTGGDTLDFAMPDLVAATLRAVDIPLDVIYEDKHLLAVNKASGMVVHPFQGGRPLVIELKAEKGKTTPGQKIWLNACEKAGCHAAVWKPSDMEYILYTLSNPRL